MGRPVYVIYSMFRLINHKVYMFKQIEMGLSQAYFVWKMSSNSKLSPVSRFTYKHTSLKLKVVRSTSWAVWNGGRGYSVQINRHICIGVCFEKCGRRYGFSHGNGRRLGGNSRT